MLVTAAWPMPGARDAEAEREFEAVSALIRAVRNARTEGRVPAGARVPLELAPTDEAAVTLARANARYVEALARVKPLTIREPGAPPPDGAAAIPSPLGAAWLEPGAPAARPDDRRTKQLGEIVAGIDRLRALLANPAFTAKAPQVVVERERRRLAELEEQLRQMGA
jgi:valyl-tRNA synthetase